MTDFGQPHFAEPQWLWLAFAAPGVLAMLQIYSARKRRQQLASVASPQFIEALTKSHSPIRRTVKNWLLLLAVAGTGLALARPQWGAREIASQSLAEDIVFAVDCSRSMLATDVSPNRLERAKLAVLDFVQRHGRGRVGLVAFAGQAFLQCPLTFDYGAFEETLRALDERTIPVSGSDLGRALDESFRAMEKMDRRKIVVLVTDGEDLEKSGVRVAENLAKEGVVVFTVGVGTQAGAEIKAVNEQGQMDFVRDDWGQIVRSRLDEPTLQKMAEATKGTYYPLGPVGEGLAKVRLAIQDVNFAGRAPMRMFGVERFHIFVGAVLIVLVVESLLGTRRRMKT